MGRNPNGVTGRFPTGKPPFLRARPFARAAIVLAVALCGGCGSGIDEAPLTEEVATSLEVALTSNQPERCAELFTEDAQIIPEDEPMVEGTEAIVAFCHNVTSPELTYHTTRTLSLRRGDLAIEQGTYRVRNVQQGKDVEDGQYLAVWKQVDGTWKIYRSFFNTVVARSAGTTTTIAPEEPAD
jgi:ketosteroid isomerase-like protein